ncbi:hypothetical protein MRX96_021447 [Rhipicephalus microplus]
MRMHPSPRTSPDSAESALRAGTTRRDSPSPRTSSGSPSIDDVGNGADSVPEPHVQDVSTHGVEVSDRGPPPPPGGRKCSLQGLSGGLAANGSKTPSYMGHAPPVPLDGGKDAVSHPRPATRASSWYTGAHTNDARTEEPGPPDGTRNRSARFGLPVGIGRRICARQSSSGTLGATGKPGQHGVVSRSSIIPAPPKRFCSRGRHGAPRESLPTRISLAYGTSTCTPCARRRSMPAFHCHGSHHRYLRPVAWTSRYGAKRLLDNRMSGVRRAAGVLHRLLNAALPQLHPLRVRWLAERPPAGRPRRTQ